MGSTTVLATPNNNSNNSNILPGRTTPRSNSRTNTHTSSRNSSSTIRSTSTSTSPGKEEEEEASGVNSPCRLHPPRRPSPNRIGHRTKTLESVRSTAVLLRRTMDTTTHNPVVPNRVATHKMVVVGTTRCLRSVTMEEM